MSKLTRITNKLKELGHVHHPDQSFDTWLQLLLEDNVLNQQEADLLLETRQAVRNAIMVDDFPQDEWKHPDDSAAGGS